MMTGITLGLLIAAGAALVAQNLLMAKISGAASTVLVALLMNSAVGMLLLSALLFLKTGVSGFGEIAGKFRFWFVIPGVLGTFFVFSSIIGYQKVGAAPTIAILVASQLVFGLAWDLSRMDEITFQGVMTAVLGVGLLICGVFVLVSRVP